MHMITPHIPKLTFKQFKNLVVILLTSSKSKIKHLSFLKIHKNHLSKYILTCLFFICINLFLSVRTCMNVKTL